MPFPIGCIFTGFAALETSCGTSSKLVSFSGERVFFKPSLRARRSGFRVFKSHDLAWPKHNTEQDGFSSELQ